MMKTNESAITCLCRRKTGRYEAASQTNIITLIKLFMGSTPPTRIMTGRGARWKSGQAMDDGFDPDWYGRRLFILFFLFPGEERLDDIERKTESPLHNP